MISFLEQYLFSCSRTTKVNCCLVGSMSYWMQAYTWWKTYNIIIVHHYECCFIHKNLKNNLSVIIQYIFEYFISRSTGFWTLLNVAILNLVSTGLIKGCYYTSIPVLKNKSCSMATSFHIIWIFLEHLQGYPFIFPTSLDSGVLLSWSKIAKKSTLNLQMKKNPMFRHSMHIALQIKIIFIIIIIIKQNCQNWNILIFEYDRFLMMLGILC